MADLEAGAELGGYRIEGVAGRGGMGVVYRARQVALDRTVALKVIAPEYARSDVFRERFKRESLLAARIEHPNALPVHEAGEHDGVLFIAMRYVEGNDLRALIKAEGALAPERAAAILTQVAAALDAAHRLGLVHRDVKPGNVLLGPGDQAYLTDFGLSKHVGSESAITETNQWVGTLDYIAPEQIQGEEVDARTDVYALGCVLYELLSGEVPFPKPSDVAKLWAHMHEPPPSLRGKGAALPPALDEVVQRALAKDPATRFPSAGDLARAATAAARGLAAPGGERTVATGPAAPQRTVVSGEEAAPAPGRGRTRLLAAVGVVALLGAGGVTALLVSDGDDGQRTGGATDAIGPVAASPPPAAGADVNTANEEVSDIETSWRPNLRIGPVRYGRPLPRSVSAAGEIDGYTRVPLADSGAEVGVFEDEDPETGRQVVREVWTRSPILLHRGVGVGTDFREAREKLGAGTFFIKDIEDCPFLGSSAVSDERVGPVSTQLFFNRDTGKIFFIQLSAITELAACPEEDGGFRELPPLGG